MTEEKKEALLNALRLMIEADLVEVSFVHIGLKNPDVEKHLRSDQQSPDDRERPKRNE